ncbi:MAG TPA: DNA-formamidopyrimidine glycosylase family protein [Mycobacteriales bacterium]
MPEGHIIHRLALAHSRLFAGAPVRAASPQGRFEQGAAQLTGLVFDHAEAHGKHLLHAYQGQTWLHVHLGLYGRFEVGELPPPVPGGTVRLRLLAGRHWADLRGPHTCELLGPDEVAALHLRLGPDPLRAGEDGERAWQRIARSRTPIATLLLDQSVVAGVGNVYRAEVLFRQAIEPHTPGRELSRPRWDAVWNDLVALMALGVRAGRIDTVCPEHSPEAQSRPPRQDRHGGEVYVYRRAGLGCLVCGTPVRAEQLAGRRLYWCPTCQPG